MSMLTFLASRRLFHPPPRRCFSDAPSILRSSKTVSLEERSALRAARKERAARTIQNHTTQQQQHQQNASTTLNPTTTRYLWYASVLVPAGLLTWTLNDPDSPPAKFSRMIGLTGMISGYTNEIAKPAHNKLLPDWSQMPNVPKDVPVPHTLVLDLENTLVCSTWDRKHGWRHAKRPGVDQFLRNMAEYYEIVLYSPSIDGIADPAVTSLDKAGCIMHRLYRDATYYHNGTHVKDLNSLNRDVRRIVVLDDDELAVQFNPDNLIRVKPYENSMDRSDKTLERITPFLVELARSGTKDVPAILKQYRGMDADAIADEYDRRLEQFKYERDQRTQRGLGGLAGGRGRLPPPEATPEIDYGFSTNNTTPQLTSKDLVGAAPSNSADAGGMVAWMNKRAAEKEEQKMLKMEKWNEVMMKKQREKQAATEAAAAK